jgi:uncharacterized membrane protein AbrB (regulator of aidB expression)
MRNSQGYTLVVVLAGLFITGAIGIMVVGAVIYAALVQGKVPDVLSNWGGVLIGFFIGQFFNFARSFLSSDSVPVPEQVAPPPRS